MKSSQPEIRSPREHAQLLANYLSGLPEIEGVCLFGSVARGDTNDLSDIDVVVVGSSARLSPGSLLNHLPSKLKDRKLTLLYYLPDELEQVFDAGFSFTDHLRREGIVLYDRSGFLKALLAKEEPARNYLEELKARLEQLDVYRDLRVFKGNFLFVLARLYNIGKALVMVELARRDVPEYNRDRAFVRLAELDPEHAGDIQTIGRLRPFYRLVSRGVSEPLPFSYHGAEQYVREAIVAIRRLAGTNP